MREFYISKIIDNAIIGVLIAMIVFYWRGAMGIGMFLNAKLIDQYRQNITKYQYYLSIVESKNLDAEFIILKEDTIKKYNKSIFWHYIYVVICFVVLFGVLSFAYTAERGIINSILSQDLIVKSGLIAVFLLLIGRLLIIAHTARGRIEIGNIANMEISALIKLAEENAIPKEEENGK